MTASTHSAEWDEAMPGYMGKGPDVTFLAHMAGEMCLAEKVDGRGWRHYCIRVENHTGRHLATDLDTTYATAVWS